MRGYRVERADGAGRWHLVASYGTSGEAWDRALGLRLTSAHGLRIMRGDELHAWCERGALRETPQGRADFRVDDYEQDDEPGVTSGDADARPFDAAFPVALCPRCTDDAACDDHEARP